MMIAHVLYFLLRSTGLDGTVCVLKQPHDSARNEGENLDGAGRYTYKPMTRFVARTVSFAIGITRSRPRVSTESI